MNFNILQTLAICAIPTFAASAQDRALELSFSTGAPLTSVLVTKNPGSSSVIISRVSLNASPETTAPMPMSQTRDAEATNPAPPAAAIASRVLVAGYDSQTNTGKLVMLGEDSNGNWVALGTAYTESGADFVGVAYSPRLQRIYLLDSKKKRIVFANMAHGAATLPTAWSVLATGTATTPPYIPALSDTGHQTLSLVRDDNSVPVLSLRSAFVAGDNVVEITHGQSVTHQTFVGHLNGAQLANPYLLFLQNTVTVNGPPSAQVLLRAHFSGQAVGSGVIGPAGIATLATTPLQLGERYSIELNGTTFSPYLTPFQTAGYVEALETGVTMDLLGKRMAAYAYVGANIFLAPITLLANPAPLADKSYSATLWIGTPSDHVPVGGGQYALIGPGAYSVASTASLTKDRPVGGNAVNLPIPNDGNLAGTCLSFQWHLVVNGAVKLTNIADVYIHSHRFVPPGSEELFGIGPTAQSRAGLNLPLLPEQRWTPLRRAALDSWLSKYATKPSLAEKRQLAQILLKQRTGR